MSLSSPRTLAVAASLGFLLAIVVFGMLDPAYSHATKAVSELGATGAPNQLAWNLIGFLGVGVLLAAFGWRLGGELGDAPARWLLALFGAAFAATAIPADMADLSTPASIGHIVASQAVFLFWTLGLIRVLMLKQASAPLKLLTALALLLAVGSIVLRGSELLLPGAAQRVSFAVVFGWVLSTALVPHRRPGA